MGRKEGRNYTCEFPRCLGDVFSWEGRKEGNIRVSSPDAWGMFAREKEGRKETQVRASDAWGEFSRGKQSGKQVYVGVHQEPGGAQTLL